MESSVLESSQIQFDKQLLRLIKLNKHTKAQAMLRRNPDFLKIIDSEGCTLLHHAVKYNNVNIVAICLDEKDVDVNAQDRQGRTALMNVASHYKGVHLTRKLLMSNAKVHLRDNDGKSVLDMILAEHIPKSRIAELCLKSLFVFYSKDYDELAKFYLECKNPLLHLIYAGNPMLTRTLLQRGYPVNSIICRYTGETALHVAVYRRDLEHVKVLIECGADVHCRDERGTTPLGMYHKSHRGCKKMLDILRILLDEGAMDDEFLGSNKMPVEAVLLHGGREELRLLFQYNLNLHAKNTIGQTPLHLLGQNDCECILEELQGRDFDVNARDKLGCTPLHYAVANTSLVDFLLKNGANVNALNYDGIAPLYLAFFADTYSTTSVQSIDLLLESGANPQIVTIVKSVVELIKCWARSPGIKCIRKAYVSSSPEFIALKPVIAHLAILAIRGIVIKKRILKQIARDTQVRDVFNFYVKKLMQMKTVAIWKSLTLYNLFVDSEEKLAVYLRNAELVLKLARVRIKYKKHLNYYHDFIRRRVQKVLQKAQVKGRAKIVMGKLMKLHYEANPIVLDLIVSYLDDKDLLNLLKL